MQVRQDKTSRRIFVTIQAGKAEVCDDTVPDGIIVEILDFDNLTADPKQEMSYWSADLLEYWRENHRAWGRCESPCPCRRLSKVRAVYPAPRRVTLSETMQAIQRFLSQRSGGDRLLALSSVLLTVLGKQLVCLPRGDERENDRSR